jgi:hypothetical protein
MKSIALALSLLAIESAFGAGLKNHNLNNRILEQNPSTSRNILSPTATLTKENVDWIKKSDAMINDTDVYFTFAENGGVQYGLGSDIKKLEEDAPVFQVVTENVLYNDVLNEIAFVQEEGKGKLPSGHVGKENMGLETLDPKKLMEKMVTQASSNLRAKRPQDSEKKLSQNMQASSNSPRKGPHDFEEKLSEKTQASSNLLVKDAQDYESKLKGSIVKYVRAGNRRKVKGTGEPTSKQKNQVSVSQPAIHANDKNLAGGDNEDNVRVHGGQTHPPVNSAVVVTKLTKEDLGYFAVNVVSVPRGRMI